MSDIEHGTTGAPLLALYPYEDGDNVVLGPGVFSTKDGAVVCVHGENYVRQPEVMPEKPTSELPERGERWPCQTPQLGEAPARLLGALYVIIRDHMQPGDVEQVMLHVRRYRASEVVEFTNPHLESYARALCAFLLDL